MPTLSHGTSPITVSHKKYGRENCCIVEYCLYTLINSKCTRQVSAPSLQLAQSGEETQYSICACQMLKGIQVSNIGSTITKVVALAGGTIMGVFLANLLDKFIRSQVQERADYDKSRYAQGLTPITLQPLVEQQQ